MSRIYLTKEFSEIDGLELCVIHWTVSQIGSEPDWRTAQALPMQPAQRGDRRVREGVIGLDLAGEGPWTLHHFFDFVRYGVTQSGPTFFDDIGTIPLEYLDLSGEFTHATLVYNIGEHGWTNVAAMQLNGVSAEPPAAPEWPEPSGRLVCERMHRVHADGLKLPHKFRGLITAPLGERVGYSILLERRNGLNPMADSGQWVSRREIVV
jgi:hypothetical protein